jgi:hypothetical protein
MTLEIQEKIDARSVAGYGDAEDALNQMDLEILKMPPRECPLIHRFTPGLYIREIFMPKNTILTSLLHLTTHPFFVLQGDVSVWYHNIPVQRYQAPYTGVTEAGTRRLLYTHEDTIWTTCHVTNLTDPDEIIESITSRDFNPHIDKDDPRVQKWRYNSNQLKHNNDLGTN